MSCQAPTRRALRDELTDVAKEAVSPTQRREQAWHESANSIRNDPSNPADLAQFERDGECFSEPQTRDRSS